jgi:WD40 repeat protein/serine/threonine protein kinase
MPFATATEFLDVLRQLHLLTPEQLEQLPQLFPAPHPDPRTLARDLIRRGWLTPYQGNQLLQGHGAELLLGSYVLLERLGEGGMGTVFKARNWKLGQVVAIKLIRRERLDNAAAVKRFQREIRACAQLNHPNIVRAFDADEVAGLHLLVMEFVDGIDLAKRVKQSGPLPVAQACEYLRQAALGLQHAHEHGLVHRDIKPNNLLLTADGTIKILDLGLARMMHTPDEDSPSTLTESGAVMGTPDYLAPEQARQSHEVDIRADLYSLGCTFYFLLTGKVPFPGGTLGEKLVKHQLDEPVQVKHLRPEVPPEVVAIVRRLMAKKREERFQTPAELEQALRTRSQPAAIPAVAVAAPRTDESLTSLASILEPPSTAEAVDSPRRLRQAVTERRWRWLNLLGGGVLLGMLGLFFLLLQRSGTPREQPEPPPGMPSPPVGGSPLDALRREQISAYELAVAGGGDPKRTPSSLVAVLGDSRLKHWQVVASVAFHPAGRLLASGGDDRTLRLWDLGTGQEIRTLQCSNPVRSVAYSPDGRRLASGGKGVELKIWDVETGQLEHDLPGHKGWVLGVAFHPDGKRLASACVDQTVRIWDVEKGRLLLTLTGHTKDVTSVAYSPDGKRLATGSSDQTIRLWDADQGGPALATLKGHTAKVLSIAYSPIGKYLASSGSDRSVRLWDLATGKEVSQPLKGSIVPQIIFSPDGTGLAGGSASSANAQLLDVDTGQVIRVFQKDGATISSLAFSRDGRYLVAGGRDGAVKVWEVATGRLLQAPSGHFGIITQLASSPDQRSLASSGLDGTVRVWNLETGKEADSLGCPKPVSSVAWSPDGESLYSSSGSRGVQRWEVRSRKLTDAFDTEGNNPRLVLRPHSKQFAVAVVGAEALLKVLDGRTGKQLHSLRMPSQGASERLNALAYTPDGKRLAAADDLGVAKVWDADSGQEVCTLKNLAGMKRWSLAISPNSARLALPGTPTTVSVRDLATGEEIDALALADSRTVGYSPDGRLLAACSTTGQLIVFDAISGKPRHEWQLPGEVRSLLFDATSRYLLTGNGNGTIYVLRLAPRAESK